MENVVWKNISPDYMVSNTGLVKSLDRLVKCCFDGFRLSHGRIIKPSICNAGYYRMELRINGPSDRSKKYLVHRLVATAFIENPNNLPIVNHINGNKLDNRVENLEWVSIQGNVDHARKVLKIKPRRNENSNRANDKIVFDYNAGVFYSSLKELCEVYGLEYTGLCKKLSGNKFNNTQFKYV